MGGVWSQNDKIHRLYLITDKVVGMTGSENRGGVQVCTGFPYPMERLR